MRIGIFAKTFQRASIEQTLDAVVAHGLKCVQFNFACAGLPSMPEHLEPSLLNPISAALRARNIEVAAVSGTFNIIHPNQARREQGFRGLEQIAEHCHLLGARLVTLCTGTFDPEDMWREHPENNSSVAWHSMREGIDRAVQIAEQRDLLLGIEPEMANVVNSARKARRLLDEAKNPRLKIVMDAANLFPAVDFAKAKSIIDEAFALLGNDIAIAHAKDLARSGDFRAAGRGDIDFLHYVQLLARSRFDGPLILHGLAESEVDGSIAFLKDILDQLATADFR